MILPYNVDVPMERWPLANWALIVFTSLVSIDSFDVMLGGEPVQRWMLSGAGPWLTDAGLLGAVLTHADPVHLIGNMIFLFVFGNAVNAKLGHGLFLASYFLLGVLASYAHMLVSEGPGLGASGAIAGITGMFIVLFPRNNVSVFYWFYRLVGSFQISAWVVIGFYFAKDVLFQVLMSTSGLDASVGFMAHIGGTVCGALLVSMLLLGDRVRPSEHEVTMLEILKLQKY